MRKSRRILKNRSVAPFMACVRRKLKSAEWEAMTFKERGRWIKRLSDGQFGRKKKK